jgi:two-component system, OmpR family, sensor kinase
LFTIKGKIILSSSLVFTVTLILFGIWLYSSTSQSEYAKLDARLESLSSELQTEIEEQLKEGQFPDSHDLKTVSIKGLSHIYIQLFDSTGSLIEGDLFLEDSGRHRRRPDFHNQAHFENIYIKDKAFRALWSPVEIDETYPYVLQVVVPLADVNTSLHNLETFLVISIPLAIFLSALAIYIIASLAFRPLSSMAQTAQRISATNLDQRLSLPGTRDELRSLAETLNRMFDRLETAFTNQRRFVADASHEIRTPLTILTTELEHARKMTSDPEIIKSIDSSLEEIDRLSRMTESLLLLARLDNVSIISRKQVFRLDELIIEVTQKMTELANKKSILLKIFIENASEINSDMDLIKQALINIIDNAIKYSPTGSIVDVSLKLPESVANIVEIHIKDNGSGIPQNDLRNIFKRFFRGETTRSESNGSGLGLPIAREIISLLNGSIDVASEIGKGTEVIVTLPVDSN